MPNFYGNFRENPMGSPVLMAQAVVEPHEMPPRPPGVDPWGSQHSGRSHVYPPAAAGPTSGTRGEAAPETPPGDRRLVSW